MAEKKNVLRELLENGKRNGKLTSKELTDAIEESGFDVEQMDKLYETLERNGCTIVDLTCPFVAKLHSIVAGGTKDGTPVIMVGEREHPEVKGTCGWANGPVYVVATPEEAELLPEICKFYCYAKMWDQIT